MLFFEGQKEEGFTFSVISYFSQVILPYLSCKKKPAAIVLLLIAAVIKALQLEHEVWDAMMNKAEQSVSHSPFVVLLTLMYAEV